MTERLKKTSSKSIEPGEVELAHGRRVFDTNMFLNLTR